MIQISVVICTYNRAELLNGALKSLVEQSLDPKCFEIIVVDNVSTDNTPEVVNIFQEMYPEYTIIRIYESRQGLGYARNTGFKNARGSYVAYIDDDCRVSSHWLEVAVELIKRFAPGAFGGPYLPCYEDYKPSWFKDSYVSHVQGEYLRPLEKHEYLDGTNMFFRWSLLQELGGFNPNLGMIGAKIAYGEETYLIRQIREKTEEIIYYDPALYVYHLVPTYKLSLRWIMRHNFLDGRYSYLIFRGNVPKTAGRIRLLKRAIRTLLIFCWDVIRGLFRRDRTHYPYLQNYFCEHTFRYIQQLGALYEQFRQMRK